MVDALAWWWTQKRMGITHSGLTDLALDVFSAPATSVDVERLFSKAGHHITPLRHRLKAEKLRHMVSLGGWFREGWVPQDLLATHFQRRQREKQAQRQLEKLAQASSASKRGVEEEDEEPGPSSKR